MNRDLESRLSALAEPLPGADWLDVQRRARRRTFARRRVLTIVVAAALALAAAVPAVGLDDVLDLLGVTQTDADVPPTSAGAGPLPYVYGDTVYGLARPRRLAAPLRAPLLGETAALAVRSPDGRYLAYHTSRGVTPDLRVHDLRTGSDRLLAHGAHMVAWGARGLAYFQADPPEYRERFAFAGRILVRATPKAKPVTWVAGIGKYSVVAWAGRRLVIHSEGCNAPTPADPPDSPGPFCRSALAPGPYVLDGPGRARFLGTRTITAVSPDGRLGFGPLRNPVQDSPSSVAHVTDLMTGRLMARLDVRRAARDADAWIGYVDWRGDSIATVSSNRLLVLRFRNRRLALERSLRLRSDFFRGTFGPTFSTPVFADATGRRVVVRVAAEYRGAESRGVRTFLVCDVAARRCRAGRPLRERLLLGLVSNPSRPLR